MSFKFLKNVVNCLTSFYYTVFLELCQLALVLLERIELSLPPYQRGVLPFNYKSIGTPCLIRTDSQLLLRESALPISVKGHCLAPLGGIEPPL